MGIVRFCEWYMLTKDRKWMRVYELAVAKARYTAHTKGMRNGGYVKDGEGR